MIPNRGPVCPFPGPSQQSLPATRSPGDYLSIADRKKLDFCFQVAIILFSRSVATCALAATAGRTPQSDGKVEDQVDIPPEWLALPSLP